MVSDFLRSVISLLIIHALICLPGFFAFQYSVVEFHDRRSASEKDTKHLFFIFFEWKNDIIEQSYLIYSTTPWSVGAGLCGVFLMLHKGYQLSHTSYMRMQKDKERRLQRKRTLKERRQTLHSLNRQHTVDKLWNIRFFHYKIWPNQFSWSSVWRRSKVIQMNVCIVWFYSYANHWNYLDLKHVC